MDIQTRLRKLQKGGNWDCSNSANSLVQFTTTDNDFWITRLQTLMKKRNLGDPDIRIGVFGSCTRQIDVTDIDLLLVYRPKVSLDRMEKLKSALRMAIGQTYGLATDFVTFSANKASENPFIQEERVALVQDWKAEP